MNPKGVTTKGMWIKVFVKTLPNTADSLADKFLFSYEEILLFHSRYDATEVCHQLFLRDAFA